MAEQSGNKWGLKGTPAMVIVMAAVVVGLGIAVPTFRVFLLISIPLGAVIAAGLYLWHKKRPIKEPKDESIHLDLK